MTGTGLLTAFAVAASVLLWAAAAVAWAARHGAFASARRDWRGCPRLRRALAVVALAAAAWAGTKPSTDLRGAGAGLSTDYTDYHGLGEKVLDRIDKIDRISEADATSLSDPVNPVNPVKKQADGAEIGLAAKDAKDAKGDREESTDYTDYHGLGGTSDSSPTPGYVLSRVGTNEVFSFDPPDGATVAENWRRRGASADWRRVSLQNWEFPFGGAAFSNLVVFADGRVRLSSEDGLRPVAAPVGLAPAARRQQVSTNRSESVSIRANPWANSLSSLFWHALTPSNSLVFTWRDALLHREAANPVSFQAELFPSGNFVFRYDFSRLGDEGLLTNVAAGVSMSEGRRKKGEGRSADASAFLSSKGQEGLEGQEKKMKIPHFFLLSSSFFLLSRAFPSATATSASATRRGRRSTTPSAGWTRSPVRPARRTRSGSITSTRARRTARSRFRCPRRAWRCCA